MNEVTVVDSPAVVPVAKLTTPAISIGGDLRDGV
jgi:hypothetical protein